MSGCDLVDLMDAQEHRGADSTGFAIYGPARDTGYGAARNGDLTRHRWMPIWRISERVVASIMVRITQRIRRSCLMPRSIIVFAWRSVIRAMLAGWVSDADTLSARIEVQSCGRSLEIIKDIGGSSQVADKHGVRDMVGTHGLGHARLATESSVCAERKPSHSGRGPSAMWPSCITARSRIISPGAKSAERQGYRFLTGNDSELIAVWVSDQIKAGLTMPQALKIVDHID